MKVSEIFYSLSGEGVHAGIPTVFVRLVGCNLNCIYCDTQYAQSGGVEMVPAQVVGHMSVLESACRRALITGGEPLQQAQELRQLVLRLKDRGYFVEVETNGSFDPPPWFPAVDCWSVDDKCPSSGSSYGTFRLKWLRKMRKQDQLKFVVGTSDDLAFVRGFLDGVNLRPTVLISPITGMLLLDQEHSTIEEYWNRGWLQECADFCKEHNVRLSLQMHKVIYGDKRGV